MQFASRVNRKRCTTTIAFGVSGAEVSDNCLDEESEGSSTCAMMGPYTKLHRN